ncbi:FecCD family ABC transporter permease [Agrobacterium tumefaciens]|uniref:Iron ABC transporter permease n=1 Tax=Agrobacterium tumefaciens TaxID=358 RepID=A0AA44JA38_AGRTU|nr:iron ABC transporter permease [Agrobacterium tumefaciens]NSL21264.1 iron ABC transporter permease [Agrobacterium tumefaciens]NTB83836.1 iron ABC transporter permease [Agrobacterium tumefaciens]NTC20695.1 iron ABC transporter permease [Agrobacterium tumefaciens]NTC29307.1 iron ABC transporter permease [Agrobacterium tumefaciens]NTC57803.1 iron ABC transporter permease [Agrobacterium tumefaciens]
MTRATTALIIFNLLAVVAAMMWGDQSIAWRDVANAVIGGASPDLQMIVIEFRLSRAILALLAGAGLAVAGTISQTVMRNPLAEPGVLGINAGAALVASVVIILFANVSPTVLPWAGFAGAVTMAAAVYALAWKRGTSSLRIILVGIGLSAMAGAGTSFLTAFGNVMDVQRAMIWLSGSVYGADWTKVKSLLLWLSVPLALTWFSCRQLDLIRFGDDVATGLGQRVNLMRAFLILLCTLISGATVAMVGLVGFVGLIAPHIARRIAGHSHRALIPVAGLTGSLLLLVADIIGRTVIAPAQLPAGIVTALLGAPFFAYLLKGRRHA